MDNEDDIETVNGRRERWKKTKGGIVKKKWCIVHVLL
jgi:hypothetical protein